MIARISELCSSTMNGLVINILDLTNLFQSMCKSGKFLTFTKIYVFICSLSSTKYATPKRITKKLDLAFVVTIQCLESCRKIGFIVIGVREVGKK